MDVPLLVFLHGPGQAPPNWQDVVSAINPDQPMVAPWLKGLKPSDQGGFDLDAAAAAVADLIEARGAKQADLVGYSLGGLVAMETAVSYPSMVAHVVAVSTPIMPSLTALRRQRAALKLMPARMFGDLPKQQVIAALDAMLHVKEIDYAALRCPLLGVAAADDPVGQSSLTSLAEQAGAVTRSLPGSDPDLPAKHPQELAVLISDFCADFLEPGVDADH
ncbi:MAG: alpha/beta hydrolase [Propionibacteriaceae bacterium]|nr:alpha/beta hydrolase [Propionibacteriaceae bacterium]